MIIVLSPAKTLDFSDTRFTASYSEPQLLKESETLIKKLAKMKQKEIQSLMHISENLATLNATRYREFHTPFTPENAKQALLAFKGDVYQGFDLEAYEDQDFDFAQDHLRILSGLYGVLNPLDLMQPYRLEMGTKLKTRRGKNLYEFWGDRITKILNEDLESTGSEVLVNLASNEYFKSINTKKLKARIITPAFKEYRDGKLKIISFLAKKARGMMANFAIHHRITDPEDLKLFKQEGYAFNAAESSEDNWVFSREA